MDAETDPAAEFLSREREELGEALENEIGITSNGKLIIFCQQFPLFSYLFLFLSVEPMSSDDFEMINNEIPTDGPDNDGKLNYSHFILINLI
jgi:hypothetical protein